MKKRIQNDSAFHELSGFHEEVLRLVEINYVKDKKVLDVGCGFGWFEHTFAPMSPKKIVGIDSSEGVLREAAKVSKDQKIVSFKIGSATNLPFKDNSFDTVVSWEVLEHVTKGAETKMISEVKRVLKPKGSFFLSTQHRSFWPTLLDPAWWLAGHRHYSIKQIKMFTEQNDLKVEKLYTKGGFMTVVNIINMYISKWILRRKPILEQFFTEKVKIEFQKPNGYVNIFLKASN